MSEKLFIHDRWSKIIDSLNLGSVTSVEHLSDKIGVSPATIRRDLNELSQSGYLKRVRGGAVALPNAPSLLGEKQLQGQAGFDASASQHVRAKRAIGQAAADLISSGDAVIIDGGSTTLELAKALKDQDISVLTTSIPIMVSLLDRIAVRVFITGGELFKDQNIVLNPYDDGIVDNYSASKVFIGAQAVNENGLMQTDPLLVRNEKQLIERADEIIVLADSSKFDVKASLSVCPLSQISRVVTDDNISRDNRKMLKRANVDVMSVTPA